MNDIYAYFYDRCTLEEQRLISSFTLDSKSNMHFLDIKDKYKIPKREFDKKVSNPIESYQKIIIKDSFSILFSCEHKLSCLTFQLDMNVGQHSLLCYFIFNQPQSGLYMPTVHNIAFQIIKKAASYEETHEYEINYHIYFQFKDKELTLSSNRIPTPYQLIGKDKIVKDFPILKNEQLIKQLLEQFTQIDSFSDFMYLVHDVDIKDNSVINYILDLIKKTK